ASVAAAYATSEPLLAFGKEVRGALHGTSYPHYVYWTLDTKRSDTLAADVRRRLALVDERVGEPVGTA
ncbi:MAG: hypothetical protein JWQ73_491, partial [Variovorax sp.]|nr:hypothetical protein [Variovorax sp.]